MLQSTACRLALHSILPRSCLQILPRPQALAGPQCRPKKERKQSDPPIGKAEHTHNQLVIGNYQPRNGSSSC